MPDTNLPLPFEAYVGDEPYVFVSYAHKDAEVVFPQIRRLHNFGYRIWYDEGIDPGNEWPKAVAAALANSAHFIVFVSPTSVQSENVGNEINLALKKRKPFLAIHIALTELPDDLELQIGKRQAILLWRTSIGNYIRLVERALPAELRWKESRRTESVEVRNPLAQEEPPRALIQSKRTAGSGRATIRFVDNSLGRRFSKTGNVEVVHIPPEKFLMADDKQWDGTRHQMSLGAFFIGKTPVTVGQFKGYCRTQGIDFSRFAKPPWGWRNNHPMVNINWQEARDFCKWAGGDLPTEAQWVKAASGTEGRIYPWGDDWEGSRLQWSSDGIYGSAKSTSAVGTFPSGASPFGCLDMAGNVFEWCLEERSAADIEAQRNPESILERVVRGGSWYFNSPDYFHCSNRSFAHPAVQDIDIGFRLACSSVTFNYSGIGLEEVRRVLG